MNKAAFWCTVLLAVFSILGGFSAIINPDSKAESFAGIIHLVFGIIGLMYLTGAFA